ncbi:hypothetical protein DNK06_13155 [Pseudomonas daroniae]|uniref:Uncharacterized protein n=1 Tax=Phytopseudomonas daroniae TaxID=2487519 RepID=A0A4Q9QN34_9GAMM|nr:MULTISPECIES: hypothetical protein [Pseudomonas]TBU79352.1 hypothetical protein DNK06_13155 [Pseudomonas daroniae]TBU79436.1 hypothetical protein DNK31_19370 [Pseudomonas sp. FRB 228]TBU91452.1 hypothetical protein DNJ99_10675 [Pseudomonas daroniae]
MTNISPQALNKSSPEHTRIIHLYGLFMITWSILESVVQAAIMKQLGGSPTKAVITTGKLQFHPRIQLLISLMKHNNNTRDEEAIKLLNKMEGFAHRNTIVHGLVIVGDPQKITFLKCDGAVSISQNFTAENMTKHVLGLNERIEKLKNLLDVSDADTQLIADAALSLAKNSSNSEKK